MRSRQIDKPQSDDCQRDIDQAAAFAQFIERGLQFHELLARQPRWWIVAVRRLRD